MIGVVWLADDDDDPVGFGIQRPAVLFDPDIDEDGVGEALRRADACVVVASGLAAARPGDDVDRRLGEDDVVLGV